MAGRSVFGGRVEIVLRGFLVMIFGLAMAAGIGLSTVRPAAAANCGPFSMTVNHGGSASFNATPTCGGVNPQYEVVQPTHGTVTLDVGPGIVTYTHVGGSNTATSDSFTFNDWDGVTHPVTVTINPPTSAITITPATLT